MVFHVDVSPSALVDAEAAFLWIREQTPQRADEWFNGLLKAVFSLENFPLRCPIAIESQDLGREIHQLLYGKRGRTYRILFEIVSDQERGEDVVRVLRIRHSAQDKLSAKDLEEFEGSS